ncbi:META domain-containing protein [Bacteroides sp.]|uniref:META domain-containing protein n=1 Tax=Bacteroides sp. TaxID=29523 RepID=UPI0025B82544|nr:META domain-containing protein [Bacteroides sp.]
MKKVLVSIFIAGAALAMSSCRSSKEATSLSSMNGEWNIIEINGTAVVPGQGQQIPFIGFDTTTGKVYGYTGCNRLIGSIDVNAKAGTIDLGALGSTRMACPDMTLEQNVLSTLGQVKGYKKMGKATMALCNASDRPVAILQKKAADVKVADLKGEWNITEVNGEAVPTGMEKQPFIAFDVKEQRIHGNAGCNLINGGFKTDEGNALSISFPAVASTMMACPDMETEGKIMSALNEVKSFGKLAGGGIGLYDANNTLVLVLTKK